ncbi:threonine/serine exporter family protein [Oceanobacillus iheyensis]|uniref:threonine/serine exporter family protein n=1 Tax=Oceanobacillus iheyensis TaxID=182710 RepID=UPI00362FAE39
MKEELITVEKICLIAGKIMLISGAETHRVEDTMNRIARAYGITNPQSYATPTGINFSIDLATTTNFLRITSRSTDLHKIAEVNHVSRQIVDGAISKQQAYYELQHIEKSKLTFSPTVQIIAAMLVSGGFTMMFGGSWQDFIPALLAGGIGYAGMLAFEKLVEIRFLADFFGGFVIGVSSFLFLWIGLGETIDSVIIGAVMPLVPGLHITNAIRDLMAGHLVSGISKGIEALLTSFAIGAGVAIMYAFF